MVEHVEHLRVAWIDTDAGGRIHFSNAFRWAEVAEAGLMRSRGLLDVWPSFPRRHVEADFHRVLVFDDEIEVRLHVERLGTTSVSFAWTIDRDGELCIDGRHTVVHVDADGRAAPLPDAVRAALE